MNMEFRPHVTGTSVITHEERRLIDEAVSTGKVQKIPTGQSALYPDYVYVEGSEKKRGVSGNLVARNPQDWKSRTFRKPSSNLTQQRMNEVERMSKADHTREEIAQALGIGTAYVTKIRRKLVEAGRMNPISTRPKPKPEVEERRLRALDLFKGGSSIREIARVTGVPKGTISADRKVLVQRGLLEKSDPPLNLDSRREKVRKLLHTSLTHKQIAKKLGISVSQVQRDKAALIKRGDLEKAA